MHPVAYAQWIQPSINQSIRYTRSCLRVSIVPCHAVAVIQCFHYNLFGCYALLAYWALLRYGRMVADFKERWEGRSSDPRPKICGNDAVSTGVWFLMNFFCSKINHFAVCHWFKLNASYRIGYIILRKVGA